MKAQVIFSDRLSSACPSVNFYTFIFFFRTTGSISTKHGTKHHWVKGFNFIQMKGIALFQGELITKKREYINEILKFFFTRTTRPISTNFGTLVTKHPWVKGIKFVQIKGHICTFFQGEIITKYQKYIFPSLEIFFSVTIWPISTKLGIKHTWMKKTKGFANKDLPSIIKEMMGFSCTSYEGFLSKSTPRFNHSSKQMCLLISTAFSGDRYCPCTSCLVKLLITCLIIIKTILF